MVETGRWVYLFFASVRFNLKPFARSRLSPRMYAKTNAVVKGHVSKSDRQRDVHAFVHSVCSLSSRRLMLRSMADSSAGAGASPHLQPTLLHEQRLLLANVDSRLPVFKTLTVV